MSRKDTRALKIYYEEVGGDGTTKTKILCPACREFFFAVNPNARGAGEYYPVTECVGCGGGR